MMELLFGWTLTDAKSGLQRRRRKGKERRWMKTGIRPWFSSRIAIVCIMFARVFGCSCCVCVCVFFLSCTCALCELDWSIGALLSCPIECRFDVRVCGFGEMECYVSVFGILVVFLFLSG
jgi:hypothetical protein